MPPELVDYILEFIRPYLTRDDWKTCRPSDVSGIRTLIDCFREHGRPRNLGHPVSYANWSFYEKVRFSNVKILSFRI